MLNGVELRGRPALQTGEVFVCVLISVTTIPHNNLPRQEDEADHHPAFKKLAWTVKLVNTGGVDSHQQF